MVERKLHPELRYVPLSFSYPITRTKVGGTPGNLGEHIPSTRIAIQRDLA